MSWFVIHNEDVTGPFSTDQVLQLEENSELNLKNSQIWGRQISQWISYTNWKSSYKSILSNSTKRAQAKVQTWFYAENSKSKPAGPYDKDTLIEKVKEIEDKDKVLVWTKGMQAWASLYEFYDLLNQLNISRRKHPRAPIDGLITLKDSEGNNFIGRIDVISPGGCGISNFKGLNLNETYQLEIKSKAIFNTISAMGYILCEIGKDKYGVRFDKINVESKSTIISYLKEQGYIKQQQEAA